MAVLSKSTIQSQMANGLLVLDGDLGQVSGSGYGSRPELIIPGGDHDPNSPDNPGLSGTRILLLDASAPIPPDLPKDIEARRCYAVGPRSLIWVRMRERVKLPDDVCAFWWQTNTLSRKGLMLVNMSMVEPGYEGRLACLFVNFGRQKILLTADMTMARLVFHAVDQNTPYAGHRAPADYDSQLASDALAGSSSFLSLDDYRAEFQQARAAAERDLKDSIDKATTVAIETIKDPRNAWRSFAVAVFGFAMLLAALKFVPWIEGLWPQNFQGTVKGAVDSALQNSDLMERIIKLEAKLERINESQALPQPPQVPPAAGQSAQ